VAPFPPDARASPPRWAWGRSTPPGWRDLLVRPAANDYGPIPNWPSPRNGRGRSTTYVGPGTARPRDPAARVGLPAAATFNGRVHEGDRGRRGRPAATSAGPLPGQFSSGSYGYSKRFRRDPRRFSRTPAAVRVKASGPLGTAGGRGGQTAGPGVETRSTAHDGTQERGGPRGTGAAARPWETVAAEGRESPRARPCPRSHQPLARTVSPDVRASAVEGGRSTRTRLRPEPGQGPLPLGDPRSHGNLGGNWWSAKPETKVFTEPVGWPPMVRKPLGTGGWGACRTSKLILMMIRRPTTKTGPPQPAYLLGGHVERA